MSNVKIKYTKIIIKSSLGQNAFTGVIIIGFVALVVGLASSYINIGVRYKFGQDLTLTFESLVLHACSLFFAVKTLEHNKLYAIVRGLSESDYVASEFLALICVQISLSLVFGVCDLILSIVAFGDFALILFSLWLSCLSSILLGALCLTLGMMVKRFFAMLYALILFFIGSASSSFLRLASNQTLNDYTATLLYWLIPNFGVFNVIGAVTSKADFNAFETAVVCFAYFLIYLFGLFMAAVKSFKLESL